MSSTKARGVKKPQASKARSASNTSFSISCSVEERDWIDSRAKDLGLDRSTYVIALTRQDRARQADFVLPSAKLFTEGPAKQGD